MATLRACHVTDSLAYFRCLDNLYKGQYFLYLRLLPSLAFDSQYTCDSSPGVMSETL